MQKKYSKTSYDALRKALSRSGIKYSGLTATYLFDSFLENSGRIKATQVYSLGLCSEEKKEFRDWRKELSDKGWLHYVIENDRITYSPGKKLLKYVNNEKLNTSEIATKKELDQKADKETVEELFATKEEVEELRAALSRVVNIIDPPDSPQKRKKLMQGGYDHLTLIQKSDVNPDRALNDPNI